MTLDRNGRLVKFAYSLHTPFFGVPSQISLCRFFWRAFVFVPLFYVVFFGGITLLIGVITLLIGVIAFHEPLVFMTVVLGITWGFTVLAYAVDNGLLDAIEEFFDFKVKQSVFYQGLKTVKGKVCPIIRIEEQAKEPADYHDIVV